MIEKNPPKKPPHISEKVLFAPDCFSLCQSALAGLVGLCYNEGAVAGRTAARVLWKPLTLYYVGASKAFVYSFAGALLCNFSLHLAESPRRARSISTPSTMLDVGLKTTRETDVTDAQSFFRAFPPTLPGDIVPLFRPQGAGDDILTKYNVAH